MDAKKCNVWSKEENVVDVKGVEVLNGERFECFPKEEKCI